jgi:Fe2+ or Zn2+ uptake regulation protein
MTGLQKSILSLMKDRRGHFTAEELLAELRKTHPSASLATVYRNLDIFTGEGAIRKIPIADGKNVYEGNVAPHEHAVCARCGRISDFTIPGLRPLAERYYGGEIIGLDLIVKCICEQCRAETRQDRN